MYGGLQVRVEARGDEGWHVEGLANAGPSAADEGGAGPASGLAGDGRKSGKARGLAGFEVSNLGTPHDSVKPHFAPNIEKVEQHFRDTL